MTAQPATTVSSTPGVEFHLAGEWQERSENRVFHLGYATSARPLPLLLIRRYAHAATQAAVLRRHPDGGWFAEVPDLPGTWARDDTVDEVLTSLEDVIFEWVILKVEDEDRDLPVIDGMDLNVI